MNKNKALSGMADDGRPNHLVVMQVANESSRLQGYPVDSAGAIA